MADTVSTPFGNIPSFIFGGNTGIMSAKELEARRLAQIYKAGRSQRPFPTTLGAGIASLGEAIGDRISEGRLSEAEKASREGKAADPLLNSPLANAAALDPRTAVTAALAGPPPNPTLAAGDITSPQGLPRVAGGLPAEYAAGISGIEADKRGYRTLGAVTPKGDRAHGLYGIMGANIPEWTQAALGQRMTPQQFLANDQAQDAVFQHRFGDYVNKYGPEGAARAWYAGEKGMKNLGATDQHGRLTVQGYGQDFMRRVQGAGGQSVASAPEVGGADEGSTGPAAGVGADYNENPQTPTDIKPMQVAQAGAARTTPDFAPLSGSIAPPPLTPITPHEIRALQIRRKYGGDPEAEAVAKQLEDYGKGERTARDTRNAELYRAELARRETLEKLREQRTFDASKRKLEEDKLRQEVEAGRIQKGGENDRWLRWNNETGKLEDITPKRAGAAEGDKPDVKLTETQSKTFGNLQTAEIAHEQYQRVPEADKVLAQGLQDELAGRLPFVGNAALSTRYRRARNAALQLADAQLREVSGASIGVAEEAKAIARLFPVYGDDAGTLKQKAQIRDGIVTGMRLKLGPASSLADWTTTKRREKDAAEQVQIAKEMEGVKPVVGKIYKQGDKRRFWTGSRWEDD